ncbi:flavin-containing monooxygenase FMO GS-OX5-like [Mizuhopecten yessoensis]|uniref:Flavin-containing monooxygenase n=1 Tax=Mizuhopecten yessoensis TaxID=6573 RepID=A0A210QH28_MIZYE|nr:flavin-containing monooxygenase FMO GS-OX5-like [Mizuhopecten yessoensis]XP_021358367.1 flavin-containing monooxygenase FMO GS-OX5-like [Mizuhopecten yessoensis]XP_021358369.1 flavin-containing monooxygenase FMO GS-OX5-like [Mizuhopecten yessoensis]OWF48027.1 Flavin-containing monooxygenase FMO GS-OX5 [Mizuhopecten yessoensis]
MTIRVAVIGAGAAGLCALRHLTTRQHKFQAVCFEQNSRLGGTWIYNDKTGVDDHGLAIHSSMYKNLKTNLPKEVMAFPDFPFRKDLPSFVRHEDMLEYLESYADRFDLLKYIKFSTTVSLVQPLTYPDKVTWQVTYKALSDSVVTPVTENFDAVMVCNGHYSVPFIPTIPGLDVFRGQIRHSHNYRYPAEFEGLRVVCLGAAASGQDISVDVSTAAKQVYMCHRKPNLQTYLPDNVEQKPGVKNVTEHTVVFENGEEVTVDALLFCTGYRFSFPFLSPECHLTTENERIVPLYKHLIHTEYPSLSLIGILKTICPFPNFHNQVLFVIAALDGTMTLPSRENMDEDTAKDFSSRLKRGMPERYAHTMGTMQWRYNDEIADLAGFERIPPVVEELYDTVHITRVKDIVHYKSVNYKLTGPNTYITINGDNPTT